MAFSITIIFLVRHRKTFTRENIALTVVTISPSQFWVWLRPFSGESDRFLSFEQKTTWKSQYFFMSNIILVVLQNAQISDVQNSLLMLSISIYKQQTFLCFSCPEISLFLCRFSSNWEIFSLYNSKNNPRNKDKSSYS